MAIPDFIDGYHLPCGEHICTLEEIEDKFVYNDHRKNVWSNFISLLKRLESLGIAPEAMVIDGSFVTGRKEPGDVDFGALIPRYKATSALEKLTDEFDKEAVRVLTDPRYQGLIRTLFGAHMLVVHNEIGLNLVSELFRNGGAQFGRLKDPDPTRDPSWVKRPEEKGILRVNFSQRK